MRVFFNEFQIPLLLSSNSPTLLSPTGELQPFKWENALSVDSRSWGHRRGVDLKDFLSIERLIKELVTTVRY